MFRKTVNGDITDEDYEKVKVDVINLLKIKYALEIISEDPLILKITKY